MDTKQPCGFSVRPSVREFIYFRSIAFLFITLPRPRSVSRNLTRVSLPSKRENLRVERRKKKEGEVNRSDRSRPFNWAIS